MKPEKQHPDSINLDLDDEVAAAVEHQYARKLIRPARKRDGAKAEADKQALNSKLDKLRKKTSGPP